MKARKPDRFERMVEKLSNDTLDRTAMTIRIGKGDIVKLLRRQHRAYVRMVTASRKYALRDGGVGISPEGWLINEGLLLAKFSQYKR